MSSHRRFAPRTERPWAFDKTFLPGPVSVYALVDPRDDRIRYVGHSIEPSSRLNAHMSTGAAMAVRRWVKTLPPSMRPDIEILATCTGANAPYCEDMWIRSFLLKWRLLNKRVRPVYRPNNLTPLEMAVVLNGTGYLP